MRARSALFVLLAFVLLVTGLPAVAPVAAAQITRPAVELLGNHPSFGFAGRGINTATGNYTTADTDLPFRAPWTRTYNSQVITAGALGQGWTAELDARLEPSDEQVRFHVGDGRILTFLPDDSGGYHRPQDLEANLAKEDDGSFTLRYLQGTTWSFDASGRPVARVDEGQRLAFEHDGNGLLTAVVHSTGDRLTLTYGPGNRLARVEMNDGRAVSYVYTEAGLLSSATGPDGGVTRYEYTPDNRLSRVVDADDRFVVVNTYDEAGRVTRQGTPLIGSVDVAYDEQTGSTTVIRTASTARVTYEHDAAGRLIKVTDPSGNALTRTFDDNGRLTGFVTRTGARTTFEFDERGNLVRQVDRDAPISYTYDGANRVTSVTDPSEGVTRFGYAGDSRVPTEITDPAGGVTRNTVEDGLITETVDPTGARTAYRYDSGRRVSEVVDPNGQTARYGYDAAGRQTSVTTPLGRTTSYTYDAASRLLSTTEPSGSTTTNRYSPSGNLLDTTDATGAVTRHEYDAAGRRANTTDPLGRRSTFAYDEESQLLSSTDPGGAVSSFTYDALGRTSTVTGPTGSVVRYSYDADGQVSERVEPAGTTVTKRDERGNIVETTDPAGNVTRYEYDAQGREITRIDAVGAVWRTAYDAAGRVISRTDPLGAVTKYEYDGAGRLAAEIDPLGNKTQHRYDAAGRETETIDPAGGVRRHTYDNDGRRTSDTTPAGLVTRYEHDADGRVVAIIDPRGGVSRFEYSARGERTVLSHPSGATRRLHYDAAGQLVAAVDPNGGQTTYGYDAAGNLTSLTDAKGATTSFTYDAAGLQTSSTDPLGRTARRGYDASGNLVSVTDPSGNTTRMEYNAIAELTKRIASDGDIVAFTYDGVGRRTSMTDSTGVTRYAYDLAGRLLTTTEPDGSTYTSKYDAAGRRTELSYPDKLKVEYRYNPNGWLVGLKGKAGDVDYTLDPDGRLTAEKLPDKWSRGYAYEGGLLTRYEEKHHGKIADRTVFTRDADGRIVTETHGDDDRGGNRVREYTYDAAGQLTAARTTRGDKHEDSLRLAYDPVGNRTVIDRDGKETRLTYDAADQLVATDRGSHHADYTYDTSGRLTSRVDEKESLSITYNGFGLPVVQTRTERDRHDDTVTTLATYDGRGLLTKLSTKERDDSATTKFRWSSGDTMPQILTQHDKEDRQDSDERRANFVYGHNRAFAVSGHDSELFSRDAYGSAISTDDTERWVVADEYDELGQPEDAELTPKFGYRGELTTGTDIYLRARTHDSTTGRFTTRDPVATQVGQADPVSAYVYAANDPLNQVDPRGEWPFFDALFQALSSLTAFITTPYNPCLGDPGNSIERHTKCLQDYPFEVRGALSQDCLDADEDCLSYLWHNRRPEAAAQAFTIHELNKRRAGMWDFGDPDISKEVDWEAGTAYNVHGGFRADILTEERWLFEVKIWYGPATTGEVETQIRRYIHEFAQYRPYGNSVEMEPSSELQDWVDTFQVEEGSWDWLTGGLTVYVWGFGLPRGHIYAEDEDDTPEKVRNKKWQDQYPCICHVI